MEKQQSPNSLRFSIDYILSSDTERNKKALEGQEKRKEPESPSEAERRGSQSSRENKRFRTIFTEAQLLQLEDKFRESQYPNPQERYDMAQDLGLSEKKVKTWFQNRRMKLKRDYWKSNKGKAQARPCSSAIAVPCSLPCLVNAQPVYHGYRLEAGLVYVPRADHPFSQTSNNFSMSRMPSHDAMREYRRLSHFEPKLDAHGQWASPPESPHNYPKGNLKCLTTLSRYGGDSCSNNRSGSFNQTRDNDMRLSDMMTEQLCAQSRDQDEHSFSKNFVKMSDGTCRLRPIVIC